MLAHEYGLHNWSKKSLLKVVKSVFKRCYKKTGCRVCSQDAREVISTFIDVTRPPPE